MRLPLAVFLASVTAACATADPGGTQVAQEGCTQREAVTGSNIPTRLKCAPVSSETREAESRRAEELREEHKRRQIRRPDPKTGL